MKAHHQNLDGERWYSLSLNEQLGNIGSEVGRTARARDEKSRQLAFERALELFDLTTSDPKRKKELKEILRARELFVAAALDEPEYGTTLQDLDRYFLNFAIAARA